MPDRSSRSDKPPRTRDPERTRWALLDAALAEFAEKGYAGARVAAIAGRAGVSKQLVSHYFGGKRGLYDALLSEWRRRESALALTDAPVADTVAGYVHETVGHVDMHRIFIRQGLDDEAGGGLDGEAAAGPREASGPIGAQLAWLRERQAAGEIAADLDPAALTLALQGAVSAPVVFPQDARALTGRDPFTAEFGAFYAEQLRRLVAHLAQADGRD